MVLVYSWTPSHRVLFQVLISWRSRFALLPGNLYLSNKKIVLRGHAIECRINAENPALTLLQAQGKSQPLLQVEELDCVEFCKSIQVILFLLTMIVWLPNHCSWENRFDALMKMQRALYELDIEECKPMQTFSWILISDRRVIAGDYDTSSWWKPSCQNTKKNRLSNSMRTKRGVMALFSKG